LEDGWQRENAQRLQGVKVVAAPGLAADFVHHVQLDARQRGVYPPDTSYIVRDANRLFLLAAEAEDAREQVARLELSLANAVEAAAGAATRKDAAEKSSTEAEKNATGH
jgi:hypothetical protein